MAGKYPRISPVFLFCYRWSCGPGSVVAIPTGRSGDRIPVRARLSVPVQTVPEAHPASCTIDTESFLGVKSGWGVKLTRHPLLVPWSRKSKYIPLLPLWAVRPVQSLSTCTKVHLTFLPFTDDPGSKTDQRCVRRIGMQNYVRKD